MDALRKSALLTANKMMIAGLLAFYFYLQMPKPFGYWVVITVAGVVRPGLSNTLGKIVARVFGTLLGCLFAYLVLYFSGGNPSLLLLFFYLSIAISAFLALQETLLRDTGIVTGLTTIIIVSTSSLLETPEQAMLYRSLEVFLGIACVAVVNGILRVAFPKKEAILSVFHQQCHEAFFELFRWHGKHSLLKPALIIGLASAITYIPWVWWHLPGVYWATVSCFFIMETTRTGTFRKSLVRLISHIVAAAFGAISVLLLGDHTIWLGLPLAIGFFIFGCVMVRSETYSLAGNTMAIALTIMLLATPGDSTGLHVIALRFTTVVAGIIVGLLFSYLISNKQPVTQ